MSRSNHFAILVGGVLFVEGCVYLARHLLARRRQVQYYQSSLARTNSLLGTPENYDKLQVSAKQTENDLQGLVLGPRIGHGSSGIVNHGRWKGAHVAVKTLFHGVKDERSGLMIAREVAIGTALSHPNIVNVYLVSTKRTVKEHKEGLETSIIMEYCDHGTLLARHKYVWKLLYEDPAAALRSEARGFRCKVADMGCSRLISTPREAILTGTYGAQSYAAPELLKEGSLSTASDIYSFAIISWHLVSCGDQFFQMNEGQLYIQTVEHDRRPTFPDVVNAELSAMIKSWWVPLPAARPSITAILADLVSFYNRSI